MEAFFSWYSGDIYESFMYWNRMTGPYGFTYALLILCNIALPAGVVVRKVRQNVVLVWIISIIVNIGMWLERFVIVVTSLHRDFLPSSWGIYIPTKWDWATYTGTLGFLHAADISSSSRRSPRSRFSKCARWSTTRRSWRRP